ncbi:ATP-binding cassette domain-containing protein [Pseudoalteromonas piscicida]|uniref:ATP-binding cassette domain-containing protein n=1 Tax=Pseudoalteromonas piscicida TaxID=43662 RepID=UPI0030B22889
MITIKRLNKCFTKAPLFNNYSQHFSHRRACLTAPNGAGKTTLLCMIAGLDLAFEGEILLQEEVVGKRQAMVALASDNIPFPPFLRAKEILTLTCEAWQCAYPDKLIKQFQFEPFLETKCADLSSGNKKKLQLINALMRNTPYLLLDEPTAALDSDGCQTIIELVKAYPGQILMTSHEPQPFLNAGFVSVPLIPLDPNTGC